MAMGGTSLHRARRPSSVRLGRGEVAHERALVSPHQLDRSPGPEGAGPRRTRDRARARSHRRAGPAGGQPRVLPRLHLRREGRDRTRSLRPVHDAPRHLAGPRGGPGDGPDAAHPGRPRGSRRCLSRSPSTAPRGRGGGGVPGGGHLPQLHGPLADARSCCPRPRHGGAGGPGRDLGRPADLRRRTGRSLGQGAGA